MRLVFGPYIGDISEYVLDLIENERKEGAFRRAFLIVPDVRTLDFERRYLKKMDDRSLMKAEILSFSRFAMRLLQEGERAALTSVSLQSRQLIIKKIIEDGGDAFELVSNFARRPEFISMLAEDVSSLRRLGFSPEKLKSAAAVCKNEKRGNSLFNLLTDLSKLSYSYEKELSEYLLEDVSMRLDRLISLLYSWQLSGKPPASLKNSAFYICGFGENRYFSGQELSIINAVENIFGKTTISAAADRFSEPSFAPGAAPAWNIGRTVLRMLKNMYPDAELICVEGRDNTVRAGVKRLYPPAARLQDETAASKNAGREKSFARMIGGKNKKETVRKCFAYIKKSVANENNALRYKDFLVCLGKDTDAYEVKEIAGEMSVPVYADLRKTLGDSLIFRQISAFIRVQLSRGRLSDWTDFLRLTYGFDENYSIDAFENFCLEKGIEGRKFKKRKSYGDSPEGEIFYGFYLQRMKAYEEAAETLSKAITASEQCAVIRNVLEMSGEEEKEKHICEKLMDEGKGEDAGDRIRAWNALMSFMDNYELFSGGKKRTASDLFESLAAASQETGSGPVPALQDEVYLGSAGNCLSRDAKVLVLLFPTEESFASAGRPASVLCEEDYLFLDEHSDFPLPLMQRDRPYQDSFLTAQLLSQCEKGIIVADSEDCSDPAPFILPLLGCVDSEAYGEMLHKKCFEDGDLLLLSAEFCKESVIKILAEISANSSGSDRKKNFENLKIDTAAFPILIKADRRVFSSTALERYARCPYSYLIEKILEIGPRKEAGPDRIRMGEIRHRMLELLFSLLSSRRPDDRDDEILSENGLMSLLEKELSQGRIDESLFENGNFGHYMRPAINSCIWSARYIRERQAEKAARTIAAEWSFGEKGDFSRGLLLEPADILQKSYASDIFSQEEISDLRQADPVYLKGKIDRIDIAAGKALEQTLEVCDYKSYLRKQDYGALWEGMDLQLPVYMLALESALKAGAFSELKGKNLFVGEASYFPVNRFGGDTRKAYASSFSENPEQTISFGKEKNEVFLTRSAGKILGSAQAIRSGSFPLRAKKTAGDYACMYCNARALCPYDYPEGENISVQSLSKKAFEEKLDVWAGGGPDCDKAGGGQ